MAKDVQLGSKVKDRITGFEGIAIGRHVYLTGCNKITVQPQGLDDKGKRREAEWFDEQSLELVAAPVLGAFVDKPEGATAATGGPAEQPTRTL
jgi:hypothetical protein